MAFRSRTLILLFLLIDLALLACGYVIAGKLHYGTWPGFSNLFFLLQASWIATYLFFIDQGFFDVRNILARTRFLVKTFFVYVSLTAIAIVFFNMDDASRTMFLGSSLWFISLKFPVSYFYTYLISIRKYGPLYNSVLVIGSGRIGEAIQYYYKINSEAGKMIGFLDDNKDKSDTKNILGKISDFQKVFNEYHFNEVIITINLSEEKEIKGLVQLAEYNGVRPSIVANYYSLFNRNFELKNFEGIPIVRIREVPLDDYATRFWKRVFDVVFSISAIILLLPAFAAIAVAIKLESRGPVFYRPVRIGKRGAEISVFKFRSMRVSTNAEDQFRSTKKGDDRITRVGQFIRKYSLDELPQFFNVVLGEMSVVGPRPHRIDLNKRFQQIVQGYLVRQYIKPGITGWAQVNGWRGPTETKYQYYARTLHDLWYIEHWNFALDLYIIFLTIFGKRTRKNAF